MKLTIDLKELVKDVCTHHFKDRDLYILCKLINKSFKYCTVVHYRDDILLSERLRDCPCKFTTFLIKGRIKKMGGDVKDIKHSCIIASKLYQTGR